MLVSEARRLGHQAAMGQLRQLAAPMVGLQERVDTLVMAPQWLAEKLLRLLAPATFAIPMRL